MRATGSYCPTFPRLFETKVRLPPEVPPAPQNFARPSGQPTGPQNGHLGPQTVQNPRPVAAIVAANYWSVSGSNRSVEISGSCRPITVAGCHNLQQRSVVIRGSCRWRARSTGTPRPHKLKLKLKSQLVWEFVIKLFLILFPFLNTLPPPTPPYATYLTLPFLFSYQKGFSYLWSSWIFIFCN